MNVKTLDSDLVLNLYNQGLTLKQIGEQVGCAKDTVSKTLKKSGMTLLHRGAVTKKCLSCGHIYTNCDMLWGIKKCPNCWNAERFEYTRETNGGKQYTKAKSAKCAATNIKRWQLGLEENGFVPDHGCREARAIVNHPVQCTACPLEKCLEEIPRRNKYIDVGIFGGNGLEYKRVNIWR